MGSFTEIEIEYLESQRLGRLATVGTSGAPHVMPVGFRYNAETDTIDIGGHGMGTSKKWRDIGRDPRVAFVVDDVVPSRGPRLIEIRGEARRLSGGSALGRGFDDELIRIVPSRILTYGLEPMDDSERYRVHGRDVHGAPPGARDNG
jgi:pyridoxamine 5'-phosphate oxidase family protein